MSIKRDILIGVTLGILVGLENLIIGYNEKIGSDDDRTDQKRKR
jgi:hypothetical protein